MKKFELLAPAGSYEAFVAAVENGADAVYLGGKNFNARANANNFDINELKKIVEYAHLRNAKIYVTLNTLLNDSELPEALDFAFDLYNIGVDAVITQDLGLAKILHEYIPNLNLHASTQMIVYNLEGVQKLKELGFKRIVLARELSFEEIKYITENTDTEIEIFIHGALCISYSGQCLMSSMIGDRSGNRGKCAQPCRLPYTLIKNGKEINKGYLLSPKDLSTIENISKLPNVTSLKIEGRMKSPEYVATVVSIYRKAIDGNIITDDDKNNLAQIFNRGGFTSAYQEKKLGKDMMCYEKPKNWGLYLGNVKEYDGKRYIKITTSKNIAVGDGIEIWNGEDNSPSTIISELTKLSSNDYKIGRINGNIHIGDKVYKTTSKALMQKAKESYSRGFVKKSEIDVEITITDSSPIIIKISPCQDINFYEKNSNIDTFIYKSDIKPELAKNNPLTKETIENQFNKTGNTPFKIRNLEINLSENIFLTIGNLNMIRRNAFDEYSKYILEKENHFIGKIPLKEIKTESKNKNQKSITLSVKYLSTELCKIAEKIDAIYVPLKEVISKTDIFSSLKCKKYILLPTVTKANYNNLMKNNILNLSEIADGFVVSNIGQLDYFKQIKTSLIANYTFNIFNSYTVRLLEDIGFEKVILSPELTNSQINSIKSNIDIEIISYGKLCVMTSEHCPVGSLLGGFSATKKCLKPCLKNDKFYLRDRLNLDFQIIPDNIDCESTIYNCKTTSIETKNLNVDSIRIDVIDEPINEILQIIDIHKNGNKLIGDQYTNGHAIRPV